MVIPIRNHEAPVDTEMVEAGGAQDGEQQPTITHTSPTSATEGVMLPGLSRGGFHGSDKRMDVLVCSAAAGFPGVRVLSVSTLLPTQRAHNPVRTSLQCVCV